MENLKLSAPDSEKIVFSMPNNSELTNFGKKNLLDGCELLSL